MIAVVRAVLALLVFALVFPTLAIIMSLGTGSTGPAEKAVLLTLLAGCLCALAKITRFGGRPVQRSARR